MVNDRFCRCIFCNFVIQTFHARSTLLTGNIVNHLYEHIFEYTDEYVFVYYSKDAYISYLYSGTGYKENAYYVLLIFPMLLFLMPVDAGEFSRKSTRASRYNIYGALGAGFDLHDCFRLRMFKLIMKTNYMCVKCRNYYESGLPSLDVVSRHMMSCLELLRGKNAKQVNTASKKRTKVLCGVLKKLLYGAS